MGKNDHIPSEEIRQDIRDTEREIENMEREEKGYREMTHDRLAQFRADARRQGIQKRKVFIGKLQGILKERGELT